MNDKETTKRDMTVVRTYNAPLDLVWRAWSDPEQVKRWWGPNYFVSSYCTMDFREGGRTVVSMHPPDGRDVLTEWLYQRIVPLERIEFVQNIVDKDGALVDDDFSDPESATPQNIHTVAVFEAQGARTVLTVRAHAYPVGEVFRLAETRLKQTLDRLGTSLQYPKGEIEWQT